MREVKDLNELKRIELNILQQIDKICREQGFRYWLCGGTLLGAVRHKGFIPWDDDIDIFMPRQDYNEFIKYCANHSTPFQLFSHETDDSYYRLYAKACAMNTLVEEYGDNLKLPSTGIWVDIFPIDGLADSWEKAKGVIKSIEFKRNLLTAALWKKYFIGHSKSIIFTVGRFLLYIMGKFTNKWKLIKKIEKRYIKNDFDKMKYCGVAFGCYGVREVVERKFFDDSVDIEFEGCLFKAPIGWSQYLNSIYGDYMQLPPEDKRVTQHEFKAYILEDE